MKGKDEDMKKRRPESLGAVHTHTHTHTHTGTFTKIIISKNIILLLILTVAILLMGIGYSAIESVTGEIEGTAIAKAQNGIFITDVEYVSDVDANKTSSKINNFLGTMLNSTIELSKTNSVSEIKYKVTVHNNSTETVPFVGVVYDDDFYDNPDITFEITQEGFQMGQTIEPNETKEVYIIFKYRNATTETVPENTVLKSYLNFKMAEPNRMVLAQNVAETGKYLTSSIPKNQIESVKFEQGKEPEYSGKIVERFDASEKQDESIIGYYTDEDNNGLYELTFISQEIIYANKNASYLCQNLINMKDIELSNLKTDGVTNMNEMFQYCQKLEHLDVNNFNTSKVTNIDYIFADCRGLTKLNVSNWKTSSVTNLLGTFKNCSNLTELDVSKWDISNVKKCGYIGWNDGGTFQGCSNLEKLDISNWNVSQVTDMKRMLGNCKKIIQLDISGWNTSKVTSMSFLFYNCTLLKELDVSKFNTSQVTNMNSMFYGCSRTNRVKCK